MRGLSGSSGQILSFLRADPLLRTVVAKRDKRRLPFRRAAGTRPCFAVKSGGTARRLGAQCALVSYGGRGVIRDRQGHRAGNAPQFYGLALPDDPAAAWDDQQFVPDAVGIGLGTNDFNLKAPDQAEFVNAYADLIHRVRRDAPNAYVFVMESPIVDDGEAKGPRRTILRRYLEAVVAQAQSPRVILAPVSHYAGVPGNGHPTGADHVGMADELEPVFRFAWAGSGAADHAARRRFVRGLLARASSATIGLRVDSRLPRPMIRMLTAALWAAALLAFGYHLVLELETIGLTEPMGMWETIYASTVRLWPHEYQWGSYIGGHDDYGPAYPALCRLFMLAIPSFYPAARIANLCCLLGACALVWKMVRRRTPAVIAAAVVAIVFAFNAGSYSIQARPDFLVLLEVAALLALGQRALAGGFPAGTLGAALGLLALAGYLTKPYVLFAWGAPVTYLVLFAHHRRGLIAGVVSGAILALGVGLYALLNPYYLFETFSAHVAYSSPDGSWLGHQLLDFSFLACGLLLLAAIGSVALWRRRGNAGSRPGLRPSGETGYWCWITLLAVAVLLVGPGWHIGAYLTYYIHLALLPLALWAAAVAFPPQPAPAQFPAAALCLFANLAVLMALAPSLPKPDPEWARLQADLARQPGEVIVDSELEPVSRTRPHTILADTGIVKYALEQSDQLGAATEAGRHAAAESAAWREAATRQLQDHPPAALYLDYVPVPNDLAPGGVIHVLRNGLPWFSGRNLAGYVVANTFRLRPYYAATNERRQFAGTWEMQILKLVPRAGAPPLTPAR